MAWWTDDRRDRSDDRGMQQRHARSARSGGWVDQTGTALGALAVGEDNTTPYGGGPQAKRISAGLPVADGPRGDVDVV